MESFINSVRNFGAKISIDDFGSGYSNFIYLSRIHPDYLKIDGSLIVGLKDQKNYDLVATIVSFAKQYNIKTIAEFVEDNETLKLIENLGIDYCQGFLFSKPLTDNDMLIQERETLKKGA